MPNEQSFSRYHMMLRAFNMRDLEYSLSRLWSHTRNYKKGGDTAELLSALGHARLLESYIQQEINRHGTTE